MHIQKISNIKLQSNCTKQNSERKNSSISHKGYVNGSYYRDEIIELAKKYRYSSNWKSIIRKDKQTVSDAIKNWHEDFDWGPGNGDDDIYNRVFLGIFTCGASEIIANTGVGIATAVKNKKIENMINEIAKCIDDLNKSSN